jgi:geranylgeranyl pyrophosphate synthase
VGAGDFEGSEVKHLYMVASIVLLVLAVLAGLVDGDRDRAVALLTLSLLFQISDDVLDIKKRSNR